MFKFPKAKFRKLVQDPTNVKTKAIFKFHLCNKNSESNSEFGIVFTGAERNGSLQVLAVKSN